MSPAAGNLLLQVQHIITVCLVRGAVKFVGAENIEELTADGTAQAARIIDAAERKGKGVAAGSVAYYVLQGMKAGRRHGSAGKTDALSAGAQLAGHVTVFSMDALVSDDPEDDNDQTLHDLLAAGNTSDASEEAGRRVDWDDVLARLDNRRQLVLHETAAGYGPNEIAKHLAVTPPRVVQLKRSCGDQIMEAWGGSGIAESATVPLWSSGLRAASERRMARYERVNR